MILEPVPGEEPWLPAQPVDERRFGVTRLEAYEDALRGIAAATVQARSSRSRDAGATLLTEVERQLAALIALGFVPPDPDPHRRRLTS